MTINRSRLASILFASTMSDTPTVLAGSGPVTRSPLNLLVQKCPFDPVTIDRITALIGPKDATTTSGLCAGIVKLFEEKWHVNAWEDLVVFTSTDVSESLTPNEGFSAPLTNPATKKKLGYVVDYTRVGTLDTAVSMNEIVRVVTTSKQKTYTVSPGSPAGARSVQVFDQKAIPTLDKFSGLDEDYFTWRELTINILGTAGFGRFLDDPTMSQKHPEVAESVFYALQGAVHGGQAQSIAQAMLDDKSLDQMQLWTSLEEYFDTTLNRANVVMFEIRCLLNLQLDGTHTARTKFISEFRDCLQRLRKNNATIAGDSYTPRAFLLVAIQDDELEIVRDTIIHKPDSSIESILTEIRERGMSLMMKDQASKVTGDRMLGSRYSRRVTNGATGHSKQSSNKGNFTRPGDGSGPHQNAETGFNQWAIPKYPNSWRGAFGGALLKILLDWRSSAIRGSTQTQLEKAFAVVTEKYKAPAPGQGASKTACSRRAAQGDSDTIQDDEVNSTSANGETNKSIKSNETPRKCIKLQKLHRVIGLTRCRGVHHKVNKTCDFISTVDTSTQILVYDTSNDQTLVPSVWRIIRQTGRKRMMVGAFAGRNVGEVFPVVTAIAKIIGENEQAYAATVHEALYDDNPDQVKSLLSVHQSLRDRRNGINDQAWVERDVHGKPGKQATRLAQH